MEFFRNTNIDFLGKKCYFLAFSLIFSIAGLYVGPVAAAIGGADIAMLVGLPVATVVYLWACRSLDIEADRRRAQTAYVGLDEEMSKLAA